MQCLPDDDRKIIRYVGGNVRLYVPGSLNVAGTEATWAERCRHRRTENCLGHTICHVARSAYFSPFPDDEEPA